MHDYLTSAMRQFEYYKMLGENTFTQLNDEDLFSVPAQDANSIAMIVQHLHGNMLSRWTDFLTSDGEKPWRKREEEFEQVITHRAEMMKIWEAGWDCLFKALRSLKENDLNSMIYIRNQGHTVLEAINRQLAHYPYHIGQIIYMGKICKGRNWQSLSIPRGQTESYNAEKFSRPKEKGHFTDEYLPKDKD
jgi:hypothetical protein